MFLKFISDVMRAEVLFSNFVAEHNIPFLVADCFTRLCKAMFPDSKIASKFSCSRTKTTQIVKRSLAPSLHQEVVEHLKNNPVTSPWPYLWDILQTDHKPVSLPCPSVTSALRQTSLSIFNRCSSTTTSHGPTSSLSCPTTEVWWLARTTQWALGLRRRLPPCSTLVVFATWQIFVQSLEWRPWPYL